MNRDIKALMAIYTILILVGWNIGLKYDVEKEKIKKIEAMQVAINLNKANDDYIEMLESMNRYADTLESDLEQNKLLKDFLSIDDRNKAIVLAIAFTESSLRYNVKHNEKWTIGIGGIRPNFYPDLFSDSLNPNSLLAIEKVYLSLMDKYNNDKISTLRHYKGIKSQKNMYLVHEVLRLEKKILNLINF